VIFSTRKTNSHLLSYYVGGGLIMAEPADCIKAVGVTKGGRLRCIFIVMLAEYAVLACVTVVGTELILYCM
jgi:hypothetical protein